MRHRGWNYCLYENVMKCLRRNTTASVSTYIKKSSPFLSLCTNNSFIQIHYVFHFHFSIFFCLSECFFSSVLFAPYTVACIFDFKLFNLLFSVMIIKYCIRIRFIVIWHWFDWLIKVTESYLQLHYNQICNFYNWISI